MKTHYLACDLGAETGRLMLGSLENGLLSLEELHRFRNAPIKSEGSLLWDIPGLWEDLKTGLKKAAQLKLPLSSISTDSWGLDYVLFAEDDAVIPPTFHYRDSRTGRGVASVRARMDWETVFAETGIQFMPINTIYQLAAEPPERLERASRLLLIGDAFNYFLSGEARAEASLASTSQVYNPRTKKWSNRVIQSMGFPESLFPPIVPSGTRLGSLKPELVRETGLQPIEVIATCSHDTGAAVAAVPASGQNWAFLSSGTWSLMGVEMREPIITERARQLNFTNEIGYGDSVRLLKNIVGLWMVQECRRAWACNGQDYSYSTLTTLADQAPPFAAIINPADPRFLSPDDMPAKIAGFCKETGQPVPETPGGMIRCVLESLALLYRRTLLQIERLIGSPIQRVHIVGGGSQNTLLNQFTANALGIPIQAGPVEATSAGNILIQALTLGHIGSLSAARQVVKASTELVEVEPRDGQTRNAAYERFSRFYETTT